MYVTIPGSVISIGDHAFAGTSAEITFEGNAPQVHANALAGADIRATYPAQNPTWISAIRQLLGPDAVWVLNDVCEHMPECLVTLKEAVEPTCTEDGCTATIQCDLCDELLSESEPIPATGHTEETDEAVDPTCTETGLTEGSHCSVCEEILVAPEVVKALGHKQITTEAVAPTFTKTGLRSGKVCENCGKVFAGCEEIPVIPEKWGATLPAATQRIEEEAFYGLASLYSIRLPENCTAIGANAFADCTNLLFVYIPNGSCVIADTAFGENRDVIIVTVPGSPAAAQAAGLGLICADIIR